jgi:hypothetical protein
MRTILLKRESVHPPKCVREIMLTASRWRIVDIYHPVSRQLPTELDTFVPWNTFVTEATVAQAQCD